MLGNKDKSIAFLIASRLIKLGASWWVGLKAYFSTTLWFDYLMLSVYSGLKSTTLPRELSGVVGLLIKSVSRSESNSCLATRSFCDTFEDKILSLFWEMLAAAGKCFYLNSMARKSL